MEDKKEDLKDIEFDEMLTNHVGEFGRYQKMIVFIFSLAGILECFYSMAPVFTQSIPDHWCKTLVSNLNCSLEDQKNFSIPRDDFGKYVKCEAFSHNYSLVTEEDVCGSTSDRFRNSTTYRCQEWEYDLSVVDSSIVTEWGLVCDKISYASNAMALFMVGRILGNVIGGSLGDIFGRKYFALITTILVVISNVVCGLMPDYVSYSVMRLLVAMFLTCRSGIAFVAMTELVGPRWRVFVGSYIMINWAVGYIIFAAVAYFVRDWRDMQTYMALPEILIVIFYFFIFPESARWLISKKRDAEARAIIEKIAKFNKTTIPENIIVKVQTEKLPSNPLDLVRTTMLRLLTLNLAISWFANGFVYYGLSLNTGNLGGDPFINTLISGAVEIPAYLFIWLSFTQWGRVIPYSGCLIVGGLAMLVALPAADKESLNWLFITLNMVGKFFISASFTMAFLYATEVYPTTIRSQGLQLTSLFARIGSVLASYASLLAEVNQSLPPVVFGVVSLVAGLLSLWLPETKGVPLQQSPAAGEKFIRENYCFRGKMCQSDPTSFDIDISSEFISSGTSSWDTKGGVSTINLLKESIEPDVNRESVTNSEKCDGEKF